MSSIIARLSRALFPPRPEPGQRSLADLGMQLIAMHRAGFRPVRGYSFVAAASGWPDRYVEVHAVCEPPEGR